MSEGVTGDRFSPEEKAAVWRIHLLIEAWSKSEPATIDGIHFRLACDVDKEVWRPLDYVGLHDFDTLHLGPELVFPWTPEYVRQAMSQLIEVIDVPEGSVIFLGPVRTSTLKSAFVDFVEEEAEREGKRISVFVGTPAGKVLVAKRALILLTQSATETLIDVGDYQNAYRGLVARLGRRAGLDDLEALLDEPLGTWPQLDTETSITHRRALLALAKANASVDPEGYVAFGYLMAKAEAEERLLSAAVKGRKAEASQSRAADGRRAKSRQATERLRQIARAIIEKDKEISLGRCARMVEEAVSADPTWSFKSDAKWVARHIKELFEPRGTGREYRPRRDL